MSEVVREIIKIIDSQPVREIIKEGVPGRPGISGGSVPPMTLTVSSVGQTTFSVPSINLPIPSAGKLFINGGYYPYGTTWIYNTGTTTLTWLALFVLAPTDEIQLFQ